MRYSIMGATAQQVRAAGGKDVKEARSVGIVFATLTPEQASELKSPKCQVEQIGIVKAAVTPPSPVRAAPTHSPEQLASFMGLEDFRALFQPPLHGEGFNVAILDTGIRETHEKISGRVVYRNNFTSGPMRDEFDHGTAVASVIISIAPLCGILNMKVLDDEGDGTEEEVVLAVDECIDLHQIQSELAPSIINLSLGAPDDGNPNNAMRVICRAAIEEGIWIFAAAGNQGPAPRTITSPACERYVAAVGSCRYDPFHVSDFSSRGPTQEGLTKPDIAAYGEDLILASSVSDTAVAAKTGTSFSVALVSGMMVIYFEGVYVQTMSAQAITSGEPPELYYITQEDIVNNYLPLMCVKPEDEEAGKDQDYGYGLPYGPLAAQVLGVAPAAIDTSALVTGVVVVGMMGVVMGVMKGA